MTIRKIVYLPHPVLRQVASPVETFDKALQKLVKDMFETMYDVNGVGLAAPQIAISKRLSVIDHIGDKSGQYVLVNPEIIESEGEELMQEGCLSVPTAYDSVKRATWFKMRAFDQYGKPYELEAEGLLAEAIQHEIDHLNGKLFVDYLSSFKRSRALKKMEKFKRDQSKDSKRKSTSK